MSTYEVERKWLLTDVPVECNHIQQISITQAYLSGVRIRKANNKTYITVKSSGSLSRLEWEEPIPQWVFNQLIVGSEHIIEKKRYILRESAPTLVVDVFEGNLEGLVLLEAEWLAENTSEFTESLALSYELPCSFNSAIEVTEDKRFNNACLATCQTVPKVV